MGTRARRFFARFNRLELSAPLVEASSGNPEFLGQLIDALAGPHALYGHALKLPGISLSSLHCCFLSRRVCPSRVCQFKGSFQNLRPTWVQVQVSRRFRLRDATLLSARHQQPVGNLRMVTPRAESSPSNCTTPGETSRSPGTITAHSRFSRNSLDLISHWPKDDDFASPIWMMDQCRTNANAVASSGNGPDRIKWLFPWTRMPTIRFQASRRGSGTG